MSLLGQIVFLLKTSDTVKPLLWIWHSSNYFNMHIYLGEASHSTADGSAVTSYNRSVHQWLSKLWRAGHIFLLIWAFFGLKACEERRVTEKLIHPVKSGKVAISQSAFLANTGCNLHYKHKHTAYASSVLADVLYVYTHTHTYTHTLAHLSLQ